MTPATKRRISVLLAVVATTALAPVVGTAIGPDVRDTLMLTQPAVSASHVAFIYAADLWVCDLDGQNVRRLTGDLGRESNPAFSPDGSLIAFSAQYEGNTDVYVMPVTGGVPRRLTWHPGADLVQGFTPDGKSVMFTSSRAVYTTRYTQLFTVPVEGGIELPLDVPHASRASYAAAGDRIAYNPLAPAFSQWKHYRGGQAAEVFIYHVANHRVDKIPQPVARANDADPVWLGDALYFRSDRDGEFNLYSFDSRSKTVARLTDHEDFPVLNLSAGGGHVIYEQAGRLHLFEPATKSNRTLAIGVAADLEETRPRFVKGAKYIRHAALSPSGARAVFEFRGEIVTVPAEKGDPRNLTNTVGANERTPAWSPDGTRIAYFSDESGEYELVVASQDGKGERKRYQPGGAGFYEQPVWAPDGQKISFIDNSYSVLVIDLKSGTTRKIASEYMYSPIKTLRTSWSSDSKWLAYTLNTAAYVQTVHVHSVEDGKSFQVTDGLSEVSDPVFDKSGKYMFFFASTDAGPVKNWFSLANEESRITRSIYVAVLNKNDPSPIVKESDEEKGAKASQDGQGGQSGQSGQSGSAGSSHEGPPATKIDFEGLQYRILDLPISAGDYESLQAGAEGQIYYLKTTDGRKSLQRFDLKTRKNETVVADADEYALSFNDGKILIRSKSEWSIVTAKKGEAPDAKLNIDAIEIRIDPRAEWGQMFAETWRINRDYFYDPGMHGNNWKAVRAKYEPFVTSLAVREDLTRLMQWMLSELSVGHSREAGGETLGEPKTIPGGLLGADYTVESGRYRFKKVYGGLNWNPQLRSPLTEPGVNVRAGEYLLAVNGRDLRTPTNVYSLFENTAGKIVDITVGPGADGTGARTVSVVPVASETALRNRDWVEANRDKVDKATGGRIAYVYVPDTSTQGYTYFKRYFYPQSNKEAVIVDERHNAGGSLADYYIDNLQRPLIAYWAMRYGADMKTPSASIQGPKVMIVDETAGSGGDLLPWMFRKFKVGTIVGRRTWGGLVGVLGFPVLMDGGTVTAPNLAIWSPDQGWVVENEGVPPDIEVEQTPADVIAGRDPQLERAIQVAMDELKKNPPVRPSRPPYPVKTRHSAS
ncbi:MAG TPA: PDZ domain-containing protein [Vicinamibacterales bacterium]|nr:PDZ domain-containing protein [Vicinamibacterales bacterium]